MLIFAKCLFAIFNNFQGHRHYSEDMLSEEIRPVNLTFKYFRFECLRHCKINDLF